MEVVFTRNRQIISNKFWYFRFGIGQNDTREDPGITERWFESGIPSGPEKLKVYVPSTWSMSEIGRHFIISAPVGMKLHFSFLNRGVKEMDLKSH